MESEFIEELKQSLQEDFYPFELSADYEMMERLSGSNGYDTLLVRDKENGKLMVAKCYESGHPMYDITEPSALKKLKHPALPSFAGEYKSDTMRCILREYIEGITLDKLAEKERLTEEQVRAIGIQLCDVLNYLHTQSPPIIHRDIKPQNVVMTQDGTVALIDFGISRQYTEGARTDTVAFGTQAFSPPEQYGFSQTDCRSDIFSLGVLLLWLLTGHTDTYVAGNKPIEKVISRCTAFAPENRYPDVSCLKKALFSSAPKARKRGIALIVYIACLFLSVSIVGIIRWHGYSLPPPQETIAKQSYSSETVTEPSHSPSIVTEFSHSQDSPVLYFTEPLIEQAVRTMLRVETDHALSAKEVASVTELYIFGSSTYTDISSFYDAIPIWHASVDRKRGPIQSLEDLRLLPNLRTLCVGAQEIRDLSPLAKLSQLKKIECRQNFINDVSGLTGLTNLSSVGLNDNPVSDLSPLTTCPKLIFLDLCDAKIYNPSFLDKLKVFEFLDISNPTDSYLYLDGKNIRELKLGRSPITSLDCIKKVNGLERLEIDDTQVSDLQELKNHPELTYLRLSNIPAEDLSVLLKLPNLKTVVVSRSNADAVKALGSKTRFMIQYE